MPEFEVHFDWAPFETLDQLALLARQDYNLGGAGDWFGEFRGGLYGFNARLLGVRLQYFEVHAWLPRIRTPTDTEYHLASILFHMDSALECLSFALNAFGWAVLPSEFRDVTDPKALTFINPRDILGKPNRNPKRAPPPGYAKIFPTLQAEWQAQERLITNICDLHDVSKHRRTIFVGGQLRSDPPDRFYEELGIPERAFFWPPMAEIILQREPKLPRGKRTFSSVRPTELLEALVPSFAALIKNSGAAVLTDAQANVHLKEKQFRGQ